MALTGIVPDYLTARANFFISEYYKPYEIYEGLYITYSLAEPMLVRNDSVIQGYFDA